MTTGSAAIHTLVLDWGGTLMQVLPQFSGPMLAWPEVAAVPGALPALQQLSMRYTLVVATNAADSNAAQVRQALDRVGLGSFISAVFTPAECAARKPEPAFFHALQSALALPPHRLCMVGDSYQVDVLGAQQAGWAALWFNPTGAAAPGLLPLHDLEATRLEQLPDALSSWELPSYTACLALLQENRLPFNLLSHVHAVAAVAYQIAVWLRAAGQDVDPLLAHRGGLLHDLAKLQESRDETGPSHAELAERLLVQRGYPRLAEVVRRHQLFSLIDPAARPTSWEQKLVYFADKLIEGGRLASLQERIDSLRRRYPGDAVEIKNILPALETMQEEICAAAGIPPAELIERLKAAFRGANPLAG